MENQKKSRKIKTGLMVIVAGAAAYFLFNSFKSKEEKPVIPGGSSKPPRVKISISVLRQTAYKTPLKGITTIHTSRFDRGTKLEIDVVQANTVIDITAKSVTNKGEMYLTNIGYIATNAVQITGNTGLSD